MNDKRFVVSQHRPWRRGIETLLILTILVVAGFVVHYVSQLGNLSRLAELKFERTGLQQRNSELHVENVRLSEQIAILQRAVQIDSKAYGDVTGHLESMQDENLALKEEVAFYRSIVAENDRKGLSIQTFLIDREAQNSYRFELVLTRTMNSDKVVSGTIDLSVAGSLSGQVKRLRFADLSDPKTSEIVFEFKYFQRLQGRLVLPPDFIPRQVYVKVNLVGERSSQAEKSFGWSKSII